MPMPKSSFGVAKPFPVVSFHRSELLLPMIHMPPQERPGTALPFLTDTFDPMLMRDDVAATRMPDMQLVVVVTPSTFPSSVPLNRIPSPRNRCTMPGPRISTSAWAPLLIPVSAATDAEPPHAVAGSAGPVIVNPFRRRSMCELPNWIHGAPLTVHVTSPTRRLLSLIVRVVEIRPLMSSASA